MSFELSIKFETLKELRSFIANIHESERIDQEIPDVLDEISFSGWYLFDVISKNGVDDGNYHSMSHSELLTYKNKGKKPFSSGSLRARVGGATKVANRLKQREIFTIVQKQNEKFYKIKNSDIELFEIKIDEWDPDYQNWLAEQQLTSPTLEVEE